MDKNTHCDSSAGFGHYGYLMRETPGEIPAAARDNGAATRRHTATGAYPGTCATAGDCAAPGAAAAYSTTAEREPVRLAGTYGGLWGRTVRARHARGMQDWLCLSNTRGATN
jgi:hypothetical protein